MNAILVAREARDEGKKDLERVNRGSRASEQGGRASEQGGREAVVRPYLSCTPARPLV